MKTFSQFILENNLEKYAQQAKIDISKFGSYLNSGIRAQLLDKEGMKLVMDYVIEHGENSTHILNAVSPAFTSAFSFSKFIGVCSCCCSKSKARNESASAWYHVRRIN